MLSKELEILKLIEELYKGDIDEDSFVRLCLGKETKIQAWKEAFADYPLYEVTKAINHYYVKKSSKTRPNIAQITAILQDTGVRPEIVEKNEVIEPTFGIKFMKQDKESGNMNWLVPHYQIVERLIQEDHYPFVQNIYNPSYEDFRECMKLWCRENYNRDYFMRSENDFNKLTPEQQQALVQKSRDFISGKDIFHKI